MREIREHYIIYRHVEFKCESNAVVRESRASRLDADPDSLKDVVNPLVKPRGIHLISSGKSAGRYLITVMAEGEKVILIGHAASIDKAAEVHDLVSIGLYGCQALLNFPAEKYKMESFIEIVLSLQKLFPSNKFWVAFKNALEAGLALHPGNPPPISVDPSSQSRPRNLQATDAFNRAEPCRAMFKKCCQKIDETHTAPHNFHHYANPFGKGSTEQISPEDDRLKATEMDAWKCTSKAHSDPVDFRIRHSAADVATYIDNATVDTLQRKAVSADQYFGRTCRHAKMDSETTGGPVSFPDKSSEAHCRKKMLQESQSTSKQDGPKEYTVASTENNEQHKQPSCDSRNIPRAMSNDPETETDAEKPVYAGDSPAQAARDHRLLDKAEHQDKHPIASGYKGVGDIKGGLVYASINWEGHPLHIGQFTSPTEAACAYDLVSLGLFGIEADINYPPTNYTRHQVQQAVMDLKNSTGQIHRRDVAHSIMKAEAAGVPPSPIYLDTPQCQSALSGDEMFNNKTRTGRAIKRPMRYRDSPVYISDNEDSLTPTRDSACPRAKRTHRKLQISSNQLIPPSPYSGMPHVNHNHLPMMGPFGMPPIFPMMPMMGGMPVPVGFPVVGPSGRPPAFPFPPVFNQGFGNPLHHKQKKRKHFRETLE